MCKGAVAAPRPLQALVYPILQEKSLSFCEKIKKTEILNENTSDCFKDSGSGIAAHGHTFIAVGKGDLQRMPRCVQVLYSSLVSEIPVSAKQISCGWRVSRWPFSSGVKREVWVQA